MPSKTPAAKPKVWQTATLYYNGEEGSDTSRHGHNINDGARMTCVADDDLAEQEATDYMLLFSAAATMAQVLGNVIAALDAEAELDFSARRYLSAA